MDHADHTDRAGTVNSEDRLERLWAGTFGDAYAERNRTIDARRETFWRGLVDRHGIASALEVGCGPGANLAALARSIEPPNLWAVDVNASAIELARRAVPGAHIVRSVARDLPFGDDVVDLVYTVGVLIHQSDDMLRRVVPEIVRCSRRFVLWAEYAAPETEEVPYRGQRGALFRRDYGSVYASLAPGLSVVDEGYLSPEEGFDRVTWQLLRKP